jgi:SAM-dependent methyltransferase
MKTEKIMERQLKQWNEFYQNVKVIHFDPWLEKYLNYLPPDKNEIVLDLGCGNGGNTLYLSDKGYNITAGDYSEEALNNIKTENPRIITKLFDMRNPLPFKDREIATIIADLSLHYFTEGKTREIIAELQRILKKDGYLLIRLNSTGDINFGAGAGTEIEKNYYLNNGNYKRFFDEKDLPDYFGNWKIISMKKYGTKRYGQSEKVLWEVILQNYAAS